MDYLEGYDLSCKGPMHKLLTSQIVENCIILLTNCSDCNLTAKVEQDLVNIFRRILCITG